MTPTAYQLSLSQTVPDAQDIDAGTYHNSCSNCRKKGGYLHCDCKDETGSTTATSVEMHAACSKYINVNGLLECQV